METEIIDMTKSVLVGVNIFGLEQKMAFEYLVKPDFVKEAYVIDTNVAPKGAIIGASFDKYAILSSAADLCTIIMSLYALADFHEVEHIDIAIWKDRDHCVEYTVDKSTAPEIFIEEITQTIVQTQSNSVAGKTVQDKIEEIRNTKYTLRIK